jgi:hypothetical protein
MCGAWRAPLRIWPGVDQLGVGHMPKRCSAGGALRQAG